ncbi:ribosome-recycling factor, mitochondrial [Aplysia californica]|uniref:Ribosome-recycling factor, mitochondrial n=1 Tax=Aplysia californica TaxID=6500 RepID=A0ABM0JEH9_APLCA|nr:ribosome-recycling factor, mitochondrial [Aplysia californica]XP_035829820.1 ribosome-recycling factor, mitochondrial [Aplysia californica]
MSSCKQLLSLRGKLLRASFLSRCSVLNSVDTYCCSLTNAAHVSSASTSYFNSLPSGQSSMGMLKPIGERRLLLQPAPMSWSVIRLYAKKGKDKGGKGHKKVKLTAEQLEGLLDVERVHHDLNHVLEDLKEKFIHQLTLRTSQGVFDKLIVKTPDGNFPLIQLGQVVQKSPQMILVNLAASPQYVQHVKEALASSGLNINPQQDGLTLFIPLPTVTKEHRQSLAKNAKGLSEQSKKHLRDVYSKYSKKIKSSKAGHSSDDLIAADDMVKDLMHQTIRQVEDITAAKQQELLGGK